MFLGHGSEDERVSTHLGREAYGFMGALGVEITWEEEPGLGHWYSSDILSGLVKFLDEKAGWHRSSTS